MWNDIVLDAFSGSSVDAAEGPFKAQLTRCAIDDLNFVCVKAKPSRVHRWSGSGGRAPRPSGSALLHLQDAGHSINHQNGRSVSLAPGAATLCDPDQRYMVDFKTPYRMFVVELPLARLAARWPGLDVANEGGALVDPRKSRVLLSLLRSAWDDFDYLGKDADWRRSVSRAGLELALGAVGGADDQRTPSARGLKVRTAVLRDIQTNLDDPELRVNGVANRVGVSRRTVQAVFEELSTTASAYILDQRLTLAAARLANERGVSNITDIAYTCGFSDAAYFSRCFRKKYGSSPRGYLAA